jgi:hypothetical protein
MEFVKPKLQKVECFKQSGCDSVNLLTMAWTFIKDSKKGIHEFRHVQLLT